MQALSYRQLLDAWESGQNRSSVQRALILLGHACPDDDPDTLARLSIGERDSRLLDLRELTFGSYMASLVTCPSCGEQLELSFAMDDIRSPGPDAVEDLTFDVEDWSIGYRSPSSADLEGLLPGPEGRTELLRRCVTSASCDGAAQAVTDIPERHLEALARRMGEADPRADLSAAIACPGCGHRWTATFDILSYLWEELGALVHRVLHDVHALALAYGWREEDVLALSPWRRSYYLTLVGH